MTEKEKGFTLYNLTDMMRNFLELATNAETEEDIQALHDTYESIDLAIKDKMDGCAEVLDELDMRASALEKQAEQFNNRARVIRNNIKNLKEYMYLNMKKLDIDKLDTGLHRVSIVKNGGMAKMTLLVKPEELPEEYQKVSIQADTKKLRQAMQDVVYEDGSKGKEVQPYDKVLARLEPKGEHIRVGV